MARPVPIGAASHIDFDGSNVARGARVPAFAGMTRKFGVVFFVTPAKAGVHVEFANLCTECE